MAILYLSSPERGAVFRAVLAEAFPDLPFHADKAPVPGDVSIVIAWTCPPDLFVQHPNLRLLISVGAGVDQLNLSAVPPEVQVVRMLEPGLPAQMAEYVTLATLALHRDLPTYLGQARQGLWRAGRNVPAGARRVGVMGVGQLGRAVLDALAPFGFPLAGYSRSGVMPGRVEGFTDLRRFLARSDILICLLPLTDDTTGLLNKETFAALPRGAMLVHAGRGRQLVAADLIAALDSGQMAAAVLDVTDPEPLPADHPLWHHPRVIVTPHVACQTRADEGAQHVQSVIKAWRAGLPVPGAVDRARGY